MRKYFTVIFLLIIAVNYFVSVPAWARAAQIKGTVKVKGLRSPANVVVYLAKAPTDSLDLTSAKFVMDQRNLEFLPHILPVIVGSTVEFPNHDQVDHNVFSPSRTKKFNLGSYTPGEIKTMVFDKPGIVEVRCDVHAEMLAFILVLKNPYFAITDKKGYFEIPDSAYLKQTHIAGVSNLPGAKYVLKTWHAKLKTRKKTVEIPANGEIAVQLDLSRGTPGVLYK